MPFPLCNPLCFQFDSNCGRKQNDFHIGTKFSYFLGFLLSLFFWRFLCVYVEPTEVHSTSQQGLFSPTCVQAMCVFARTFRSIIIMCLGE